MERDQEPGNGSGVSNDESTVSGAPSAESHSAPAPVGLSEILESITDGFVALDGDWRFQYVNAAAEAILQKNRRELLGQDHWIEYAAVKGTVIEREYRACMADRQPRSFEFEAEGRWFEFRLYPSRSGGLTIYFKEITDRKQTEFRLRQRDWELQTIMDNVPVIVSSLDREGKF